ncbi:predicted protein [Arabidopsis lyrata subsp. lyrata]|uniref:Predicted protein n=1 Tax=Arabidopsis lyrata subsp. lyrata TaxID=81972 RepID=D7M3N4_ARALL|nr:predicted protein [Arabidopsis lyrata subsp. lyrata]
MDLTPERWTIDARCPNTIYSSSRRLENAIGLLVAISGPIYITKAPKFFIRK